MHNHHAEENLSGRSLYLRVHRRLWIVPAAALIAAVLFGLLYTARVTVLKSQRRYKETSKYYITFAFNEQLQKAYDYYNAATWDDVLYAHPAIRERIEENLPEGMTMEEAQAATEALVLSDIRYLTVEVTCRTAEQAAALSDGIREGLTHFPDVMEEFTEIEFLSSTEPQQIIIMDRTRNAVLLGAFLGFVFSFCLIVLKEAADDGIYTPEEAAARFGIPVLGILAKEGSALPARFEKMLEADLRELCKDKDRIAVISGQGKAEAEKACGILRSMTGGACEAVPVFGSPEEIVSLRGGALHEKETPAVLLLSYGKEKGCATQNLLDFLSQQHVRVEGLILTEADGRFLTRYYGMEKNN